jgi:caffeoyl-CoA O-methyltransferase
VPVVPDEIDAYCEAHTTPPPRHLRELAEETRASLVSPQMLTGVIEGRFLETLVFAAAARRVLELGTYSGYSALSMAAALPEDGKVVSCELDPERAEFARRHIEAAGYADRIELRVGPALETLERLQGPFDLIFIDADKTGYPRYYEACVPLLAERGLLVIDNTLWSGRVLEGRSDGSEATEALTALNDRIAADERVVAVVLPIRDGVTLVRRQPDPRAQRR